MTKHGITAIIHYVDDFLLITLPFIEQAEAVLSLFKAILDILSISYKNEKIEESDTKVIYFRIQFNTINMSIAIFRTKCNEIILNLCE